MTTGVSRIWCRPDPNIYSELEKHIDRGCRRAGGPISVFFRADDVGVPSRNFFRLLDLFNKYRLPLALAVVPAWLTAERWRQIRSTAPSHPRLWCWHQHGWQHENHEAVGKKCEFGSGRTEDGISNDVKRGRERLDAIMGNDFFPVFTPPWNRCDGRTLHILSEQGFLAVSRAIGEQPVSPEGLRRIDVNIDLHTRKGSDPKADRLQLLNEIEQAIAAGRCGFMLHHQRMNGSAAGFLEMLLRIISRHQKMAVISFDNMV